MYSRREFNRFKIALILILSRVEVPVTLDQINRVEWRNEVKKKRSCGRDLVNCCWLVFSGKVVEMSGY
jgi:hypothetical protein